jgi:integrase
MAWAEPEGRRFRGRYRDAAGTTHSTATFPTKKKALDAARNEESKVRTGTWFDPTAGKVTFSDYFESQWFPNRGGEQGTRDTYFSHYNASLKPKFGNMELRRISSSTVQGWVTEMSAAGVKPSTIQAKVKALQTVLAAKKGASAIRDGLIDRNPVHGVLLPTTVEPEVHIYEPEEVDAILEAMDPWWRMLPMLASETGLRWGELMGLTPTSFGLNYRSVRAARTVVETAKQNTGNGTRFMWKDYPKGKKLRTLSLRQDAAEAISRFVAERELGPDDRLFSMPDKTPPADWHPPLTLLWTPDRSCEAWPGGLPISRAFFRQSVWIPAIEKAGLPYRKFHATRASHLSWLIAAGVDMNTVMDRAGHRDYDTTRRYMGKLKDSDQRASDALDALMQRRGRA